MAEQSKKLRITARVAGFRRAGRAWGTEPTEVQASEFTKEQLAALMSERELVVEEIEDKPADKTANKTAAKKDGE